MENYEPTCKMRFIERSIDVDFSENGERLPKGIVRAVKTKTLQQFFISHFEADDGEWIDVPIVSEI